jgi:hypothetical protein
MEKFLLCPAHSQKTAFPATLQAILRINKSLLTPRHYPSAEAEIEVFGQALANASAVNHQ